METKLNIANPKDGKTITLTVEDTKTLQGKKIGESFKGEAIDKTGYQFRITGGSDSAGFPMRPDVSGQGRSKVLISGGVGLHSDRKGLRRRRTVAGNAIGPQTAQINLVIEKAGSKPLIEPPAEEAAEDAPKEEAKEAPAEKKE